MTLADRVHYYRRIGDAYLLPGTSHLTFWHDFPQVNANAPIHQIGEYYMLFSEKADYCGPYDGGAHIPMLNYRGRVGLQYNPIAIAQWGLANFNLFLRAGGEGRRERYLAAANWLTEHLEQNSFGVWVWNHRFDWEYRTPLRSPWYSGLAQGQGISLLVRAWRESGVSVYLVAAERAFDSLLKSTQEGGVTFIDENGNVWFEEYIVSPPTHILNGFISAAWGVYDYFLATGNDAAQQLFAKAVTTLCTRLHRYDLGFWSLYELSGTRLPMVASRYYHQLHVAQLRIMYRITGIDIFAQYADRWTTYAHSRGKRTRALFYKSAFKLCYY